MISVSYKSDRHRGKDERRRARHDMRNGREPRQKYTTGRYWSD